MCEGKNATLISFDLDQTVSEAARCFSLFKLLNGSYCRIGVGKERIFVDVSADFNPSSGWCAPSSRKQKLAETSINVCFLPTLIVQ